MYCLDYIDVPDQCKDLWLQLKATLPQEPLSLDPSDPTQIGMWLDCLVMILHTDYFLFT